MNTRLIISLLCAGALAFACGPGTRSDTPAALADAFAPNRSVAPATPRRHDTALAAAAAARRGEKGAPKIDSKFSVDVTPREVHLALDVMNTGTKFAELDFPNGRTYDFVVLDSIGRPVWHWSEGRLFTQTMQNKQLGSGDAMRVAESWRVNAKPGRYTAIATLNSSNYPVQQRADFVLR